MALAAAFSFQIFADFIDRDSVGRFAWVSLGKPIAKFDQRALGEADVVVRKTAFCSHVLQEFIDDVRKSGRSLCLVLSPAPFKQPGEPSLACNPCVARTIAVSL